MEFNSLGFVAFFISALAIFQIPMGWTARKAFLLVASYAFYAAWNPPFVVLLWISTLCDWFVVKGIVKTSSQRKKKLLVMVSLLVNLGLLGYFKYAQLAVDSFAGALNSVGIDYDAPTLGILLPVGISFYTFQTMSYTLDVYHGALKGARSFLNFALYVTFFPQLVAGPIVRAGVFLPQCENEKRLVVSDLFSGLTLLVIGIFSKMVLSDCFIGPVVSDIYAAVPNIGLIEAWGGAVGFLCQLFLDFSGYSLCAIGIARCLGFYLPQNFRYPFGSKGFADYWRRWHISLSTWIRDYLYMPLAMSLSRMARSPAKELQKYSVPMATLGAVVITMVVMGLWHGASWMMALWGLINGFFLVADNRLTKRFKRAAWPKRRSVSVAIILFTFLLSAASAVFFRAPTMEAAWGMLTAMFSSSALYVIYAKSALKLKVMLALVTITVGWHIIGRQGNFEDHWERLPALLRSLAIAVMLFFIATVDPGDEVFIYFQF